MSTAQTLSSCYYKDTSNTVESLHGIYGLGLHEAVCLEDWSLSVCLQIIFQGKLCSCDMMTPEQSLQGQSFKVTSVVEIEWIKKRGEKAPFFGIGCIDASIDSQNKFYIFIIIYFNYLYFSIDILFNHSAHPYWYGCTPLPMNYSNRPIPLSQCYRSHVHNPIISLEYSLGCLLSVVLFLE